MDGLRDGHAREQTDVLATLLEHAAIVGARAPEGNSVDGILSQQNGDRGSPGAIAQNCKAVGHSGSPRGKIEVRSGQPPITETYCSPSSMVGTADRECTRPRRGGFHPWQCTCEFSRRPRKRVNTKRKLRAFMSAWVICCP